MAAQVFICERCWKGSSRDRNVRKNYASAFANARRNAARHICTSFSLRLDPAAAAKIHPNDAPKIIRAVEVCLTARGPMSQLWEERGRDPLRGFRILRIGLNPEREALYARLNQRACQMFDNGLIDETAALLERYGERKSVTPLDSLGYKQATQFLRGELTREQALTATQQGHRNYAKRQMTWFRREPDVTWLAGFGDDPAVAREAAELVSGRKVVERTRA